MLNKKLISDLSLVEGEKIKLMVWRSGWAFVWPYFWGMILVAVAFFFLYPLFKTGLLGIAAFSLLTILGLIIIIRTAIISHNTVFIITDRRLIDIYQSGFGQREITNVFYNTIQEIHTRKSGLFKSLLGLGEIYISFTDRSRSKIKLTDIGRYQQVVKQILAEQRNYSGGTDDQEAEIILNKIKNKLGTEKFNQLVGE